MKRRQILAVITIAAASLSLAGCKIVSLEQEAADTAANAFDARAYADNLWTARALPHFSDSAYPADTVLDAIAVDLAAAGEKYGFRPSDEGAPWTFIVKGTGVVTAKNTKSRAGSLTVATDGTPSHQVSIQIGPVVRGNTTRDALPFVSFKDFTNQLEFADAGTAFTALAMAGIANDVPSIEAGSSISFLGSMSLNAKSDKIVITPVTLRGQ